MLVWLINIPLDITKLIDKTRNSNIKFDFLNVEKKREKNKILFANINIEWHFVEMMSSSTKGTLIDHNEAEC